MKLHELKVNEGARKDKSRVGRGHAGVRGKQAGKGQSGQNKRGGTRPGFEGGQNPWFRRLPKRGFQNVNHVEYQVVSLETLENKFNEGDVVDFASMTKARVVTRTLPVKILSNKNSTKKLTKKLTIKIDAVSESAKKAIESVGGTIEVVKFNK